MECGLSLQMIFYQLNPRKLNVLKKFNALTVAVISLKKRNGRIEKYVARPKSF